jgi:hypothetical protein
METWIWTWRHGIKILGQFALFQNLRGGIGSKRYGINFFRTKRRKSETIAFSAPGKYIPYYFQLKPTFGIV